MEIGLLIKSKFDDSSLKFHGNIQTMQHTIKDFELHRNSYKTEETPKHPDFIIYYKNRDGALIKIGAAWYREYIRNGISGEMVSLTFDDPSFDATIHATAFRGEDEYRWPITWRRERSKSA